MNLDSCYIRFFERLTFSDALAMQDCEWQDVHLKRKKLALLGFQSSPVVTLGVRADAKSDLMTTPNELEAKGFRCLKIDRGGHATLHGPGQLVIFPVASIQSYGVRGWMRFLAEVTSDTLKEFGVSTEWNERQPGLYTRAGKMVAMGLKVRRGISTHGLAINVCNSLSDFAHIRACGVSDAALDRLENHSPGIEIFEVWRAWKDRFLWRYRAES